VAFLSDQVKSCPLVLMRDTRQRHFAPLLTTQRVRAQLSWFFLILYASCIREEWGTWRETRNLTFDSCICHSVFQRVHIVFFFNMEGHKKSKKAQNSFFFFFYLMKFTQQQNEQHFEFLSFKTFKKEKN
jgi:hypothetical protein